MSAADISPTKKRARVRLGRRRLYASAEDLECKIEAYLAARDQDGAQPTMTGLCEFLGFTDRGALRPYLGYGEAFRHVVKRAKLAMEADLNWRLIDPQTSARQRRAYILQLRNNYGWREGRTVKRKRRTWGSHGARQAPESAL